jgi:hypothetical protein
MSLGPSHVCLDILDGIAGVPVPLRILMRSIQKKTNFCVYILAGPEARMPQEGPSLKERKELAYKKHVAAKERSYQVRAYQTQPTRHRLRSDARFTHTRGQVKCKTHLASEAYRLHFSMYKSIIYVSVPIKPPLKARNPLIGLWQGL